MRSFLAAVLLLLAALPAYAAEEPDHEIHQELLAIGGMGDEITNRLVGSNGHQALPDAEPKRLMRGLKKVPGGEQ